jgi:NADPH:quinone reductase
MRAYIVDHAASEGVRIAEVPDATAGEGRLVVRVEAVSLNRGEVMHVAQMRLLPDGAPIGWDFAGTVVHAATDGSGPAVGTRVFGWSPRRGSWAELLCVDVCQVAPIPDNVCVAAAATLGVAALTALAALGRARTPLVGSRVVVTGATGGVGTFATQLALASGAETSAVVRPGTDVAELAGLLAPGVALEHGLDPDGPPSELIIESVGGDMLSAAFRRVSPGGTVVSLGRTTNADASLAPGWFLKDARIDGLSFSRDFTGPGEPGAALARLGRLVGSGRLQTNIGLTTESANLSHAMRALLDRTVRGKVVVRFGD